MGIVNIHINDEKSLFAFSYQIKICICELECVSYIINSSDDSFTIHGFLYFIQYQHNV